MEKMVALTGGVFFSFIGFILPGAFFLKLRPPPAEGRSSPSVSLADVARASALITLGDQNANEAIILPDVAAHYSLNKGSSTQSMPTSLMGSFALIRQTFLDAAWFTQQQPRPFSDDTLEFC